MLHEGKEIEVRDLDVLTSKEEWNEYQLANGKVLRIKLVVSRVFEALSEKTTVTGEPLYIVQSQNVVVVK